MGSRMLWSSCQGELVVRRVVHPPSRPTHLDAVCLDCGAKFWAHVLLLFEPSQEWTSVDIKCAVHYGQDCKCRALITAQYYGPNRFQSHTGGPCASEVVCRTPSGSDCRVAG